MIEYITKITKEEIINHPDLRDDILLNFDSMVDKIEDGKNADHCLSDFVIFLDNFVRNQPVTK